MISIKVRGEANAQAIFDCLNGQGVSWYQPNTNKGCHQLIMKEPKMTAAQVTELIDSLRIKASVKVF